MRMGAVTMPFRSDLCLTAALSGLMVTMLLLGAILVRSAGPAEKGGKSADKVTLDIGVADMRGTLP